jgi:hypothetical protein
MQASIVLLTILTNKLAALAQALITLGSVGSPKLHKHPEQLT